MQTGGCTTKQLDGFFFLRKKIKGKKEKETQDLFYITWKLNAVHDRWLDPAWGKNF